MGFEVALLQWSGANRGEGVRLVGRSSAPALVEVVREHLLAEATEGLAGRADQDSGLRLVPASSKDPDSEPDEDS